VNRDSLLFFDEVQLQPKVINRLRYFYEQRPELKIIAAGSLLEVTMDAARFSMPVGRVQYYQLGPMSFCEFLMAKNEDIFLERFNSMTLKDESDSTWLEQGADLLKEFYYTGGMPEAVKCWTNGGDHEEVRDIQNAIIQTYRDDIPKYTSNKEHLRVMDVFEYTAAHLGEKVVFSDVSNTHSKSVQLAIDLLAKAGVITRTAFNYCNGLPLSAGTNPSTIKLFFLDIGLYNALHNTRWADIFRLPSDRLLTKGAMAEQFIAQHLKFINPKNPAPELYYWLYNKRMGAAEIDFIHSHGGDIYPIEVKAGKTGKIKSLWKYIEEKNPEYVVKFDLMERRNRVSMINHKQPSAELKKELTSHLIGLPIFEIEMLNIYLENIYHPRSDNKLLPK
jgi:predicted AAA+ superfamily ATPase